MTDIRNEAAAFALGTRGRAFALFALIVSGEAIFFLPFVLPRVFRPTFLEVFGIDNLQLGAYYSVYGVVAIGAYLLGGPLADRFPAHRLMALALAATATGGILLVTVPPPSYMYGLYAFWGLTTILLFWSAMMRATRMLGGAAAQGKAFGMLDGGRGLVAAIVGSIAVWVFALFIPTDAVDLTAVVRREAFQKVIVFFSIVLFATVFLVYHALKGFAQASPPRDHSSPVAHLREVARMPVVWLQAAIILCAYSGYRIADDFSLLARDALGYSEVQAARVGTLALWLRPVAAVGAGLIGDRTSISRMTMVGFSLMCIGGLLVGFGPVQLYPGMLVYMAVVSTSLGVYAMRGLYFAIMEEGGIPWHFTGSAVGLASIIGYLPDVYMGPIMGVLLDDFPGLQGHRYVFMLLAGFAVFGALATWRFRSIRKASSP